MTFSPMPMNMDEARREILSWREQYKRDTAEIRRLNGLLTEWQQKAATWLATPEAASRLEGYRDLAQKLNAALWQRDVCVQALEAAVQWGGGMADAPRAARPEWFDMARAAIAQAQK